MNTKTTAKSVSNQCMGCQAKWPLMKTVFGSVVHMVVDGYPHEVVSCTANRYVDTCQQCKHPLPCACGAE